MQRDKAHNIAARWAIRALPDALGQLVGAKLMTVIAASTASLPGRALHRELEGNEWFSSDEPEGQVSKQLLS